MYITVISIYISYSILPYRQHPGLPESSAPPGLRELVPLPGRAVREAPVPIRGQGVGGDLGEFCLVLSRELGNGLLGLL